MKTITFDELPDEAKNGISEEQQSYIDEFQFQTDEFGYIQAWYGGEFLGYWDNHGWK